MLASISAQAVLRVENELKKPLGSYYDEFKRVMTDCDGIIADFETRTAIVDESSEYNYHDVVVQIYVDNESKTKQLSKFFEYAGYKCTDDDLTFRKGTSFFEIQIQSKLDVSKKLVNEECFGILQNYVYFKPQMGFYFEHPDMVLSRTTDAHIHTLYDISVAKFLESRKVIITTPYAKMYIDLCKSTHVRSMSTKLNNELKERALTILNVNLADVRQYINEQYASNDTFIGSLGGLVKLLVSLKDKPDDLVALATQLSTQEPTTCYVYKSRDDFDTLYSI